MRILMISEDPQVLVVRSAPRRRMADYARVLGGELHIVALATAALPGALQEGNLFLYGAAGKSGMTRRYQLYRIARMLLMRKHFDVIAELAVEEGLRILAGRRYQPQVGKRGKDAAIARRAQFGCGIAEMAHRVRRDAGAAFDQKILPGGSHRGSTDLEIWKRGLWLKYAR